MNKNRIQYLTKGCLGVKYIYIYTYIYFREKQVGKEQWVSTCMVANPTYGIAAILPVVAMDLHIFLYSLRHFTFATTATRPGESGSMCLL